MTEINARSNDDPSAIVVPTGLELELKERKLYVPVVTLSKENDTKLLEQLKRTIKWNKYRSQITIQPQNNNLNYLIDPTFTNFNRLLVLSFTKDNAGNNRDSDFSDYYVPNVEIKDFNVLIDGRFFDLPVRNEEEIYEKNIEMSNNNDYTTGNLFDFTYFKENYKLIAIDLSKQTKLKDRQQINFIGKLENQANGQQCFSSLKNQKKLLLNFHKILPQSYK